MKEDIFIAVSKPIYLYRLLGITQGVFYLTEPFRGKEVPLKMHIEVFGHTFQIVGTLRKWIYYFSLYGNPATKH